MGIALSKRQLVELKAKNFVLTELPGGDSLPRAQYHNPKSGQEFKLLADMVNMQGYLAKGLLLGPAPEDLREKWKAGEAERIAEDDRMTERYRATDEHKETESTNFNEAVQAAVAQVLKNLGKDIPTEGSAAPTVEVEEKQLKLL